jgi:hypothetical protein
MIIGILLKNYKIYGGVKYIPVTTNHNFIAYIGDNGVGKSSILEALDTYFNGREWNITKGASTTDANTPYVVIVQLLKKDIVDKIIKENKDIHNGFDGKVKEINAYLWNFESVENDLGSKSTEAKNLVNDLRKIDRSYQESHYLIISGNAYKDDYNAYFGSFDSIIAKLFDIKFNSQKENENKKFREDFKYLNYIAWDYYSYIYMPVEAGIEEFTKLETDNMQKLIGTDIGTKIAKIIGEGNLKGINKDLNNFVDDLEKKLKLYAYKSPSNRINITMKELIDKVIELFFSIRILHKIVDDDKIKAERLSSGEKRQALIDVAAALLDSQIIEHKEVILAIDEPEASLNLSKNFTQFEKLIEISQCKAQVVVTTHWYGFLPVAINANAHFLTKKNASESLEFKFNTFDLYNYREKLRQIRNQDYTQMPSDIQLKSIYDLVQSIVSSVRLDEPYNWLICEGSSDKIYFDFYFEDLVKNNNLRILPVGGASEVIKIYNYLRLPTSEKDNIKGKIYCLIDSDGKSEQFICDSSIKNMVAKRILNNSKNQRTSLVDVSSNDYEMKTEIEECLDGTVFIETLKTYTENKHIVAILEDEKNFKDISLNSYFCFNLRDDDRQILKDFFDQDNGYRKIEFAKQYVKIASKKDNFKTPEWIDEIKKWIKE